MRKLLLASLIVLLSSAAIAADDANETAQINITSRSALEAPRIIVKSKFDFEKTISLKLKTNPALDASDVLIRTLSKIGMVDANGVKITSGFDIDVEHDLVVAFSGGTSEIIKTAGDPSALHVVASFRDANGNFVSPPPDSVAVYSISGEKLCFDYKTVQQAKPKIAIGILLDRSGSMYGNMSAVISAAHTFLNALPKSALCAVGSFTTELTYGHKHYQVCSGGGFGFDDIQADGGTDIYFALNSVYDDLSGANFNSFQKAVIVITDGYTMNDPKLKAQLLAKKKDILTFVYFIGGNKKDDLEGITDHFIAQDGDLNKSLDGYFGSIEQAYNSQKILSVHSCTGGTHAAP